MPQIKILNNDVFYGLSGLNPQRAYGPDGVPLVLKNCASVLMPCLVKLFRLILSTCVFPSCWKYAYFQPVPKKSDRSIPSNYRPIALLPCLSKVFQSILNRKILKHISTSNLHSDRQYGFRKERFTGDLLAFLTNSSSSSLNRFGETSVVALDISKAFDKVWHKAFLLSFPPSDSIPLSVLSSRVSFLIDPLLLLWTVIVLTINSGIPQGSVLSPTLFLMFINDLLSITSCSIHFYADDTTLHYSTSFSSRPNLQSLDHFRLEASERLTSDLALISEWGRKNLVSFNASKTQYHHLTTRHDPLHNYPRFFENTQLFLSSTIKIHGLSLSKDLNWKLHISFLAKSASSKLGVLYRLKHYFSHSQLLTVYKDLVRPCLEYACHVWGWGGSTHTALLDRVESKTFRLISSLTKCGQPLKLRRNVASLSIFYSYFHANCSSDLTNCMAPLLQRPRCTRLASAAHPYSI